MGFTSTATIDRPVEEVWAFLTDLSRAPEWVGAVERIETVGGEPLGEGVEPRLSGVRRRPPVDPDAINGPVAGSPVRAPVARAAATSLAR